ncbi:quorum sensing histidine kinase QseC [Pragia fontium]|uniref:quorum sensing histidine kinase QseC n=1 Tax=Pragia fontium TaxID=82985 RepID=UPI00064998F4|nr:quorum sensing histidine kinase QseC [Pragia fontium]AKJ42357.1 sensor protein QseC [Pragia fontium]
MKFLNLKTRLILMFSVLAVVTWGVASFIAWLQTSKNINELFDTQQMVFAKRLSVLHPDMSQTITEQLPKTKKLVRHNRGKQDDDALAFAIFTPQGTMVLNDGDNGRKFIFNYHQDGFVDSAIQDSDDLWRIVWLQSADKNHIIAVGQEWDYRQDMAKDIVISQLMPWLIALPIMMLLMSWLIAREFLPLRKIAERLNQRKPDDESALDIQQIPSEVRPMVEALNHLFARIGSMLTRERRFTSDAAHELRSPLAALKVQTEVVQLAGDDEALRNRALGNLIDGIDRSTRVVDQLLTLSRLESLSQLDELHKIDWLALLQTGIADIYYKARAENIEISLEVLQTPRPIRGHQLLLSVLIRNLLDNAIRYAHTGGNVSVILRQSSFSVEDDGPGVSDEFIQRIGERFFRPPGQEKTGSGLGLSIVQRIANLHGMSVSFNNRLKGGFEVRVNWH